MNPSLEQDAQLIWQTGVKAVGSQRLVENTIHCDSNELCIGPFRTAWADIRKIVVVGAGKAGAGMAAGLLAAIPSDLAKAKSLSGWVNVPNDCAQSLQSIHLHPARPAGHNRPTPEGVIGSHAIVQRVTYADSRDLVVCLISGGGSALLPLPATGITWQDKAHVTDLLASHGFPIQDINGVRRALSAIKGGGLARACRAGQLVSLILSDVLGDPLDVIASGPTVLNTALHTAQNARRILLQLPNAKSSVPTSIWNLLDENDQHAPVGQDSARQDPVGRTSVGDYAQVTNIVIGNIDTAVQAAAEHARQLGYQVKIEPIAFPQPTADEAGRQLAQRITPDASPHCIISGGEPVVHLVDDQQRGRGGRNQQLVLSALCEIAEMPNSGELGQFCLLSGGTDGEDGPTDAAGAWITESMIELAHSANARSFQQINDAYTFFEKSDSLLITGPTQTNVCDLRVLLTRS